jgi:partner of Y14 and mago protein
MARKSTCYFVVFPILLLLLIKVLTVSLRKELKIRPGFTPQEDVGRFRGSRQKAQEAQTVPGSDRPRPQPAKPDNPFDSTPSSSSTKTKAQIKNEKRRANKKVNKNWDESDEEDDDGAIGDEFAAGDEARNKSQPQADKEKEKENEGKEGKAWPVEDGGAGMIGEEGPGMGAEGGGIPDDPVPIDPKPEMATKEDGPEGTTAILSPPPPGHPAKDPAAPSIPPSTSEPEWRTASSRKPVQKPHPIQGGRKGPIGLAHPPPIESKARPNRNNQRKPQPRREASSTQDQPKEKAPPQPRVRKEVKVRETGLGSLADRVKGLVIGNMDDGKKKKEKPVETASKSSA